MADTSVIPDAQQWYSAVPRSVTRHAIFGLGLMVVAFGGFGLWAFRAPLAAAVISQGSFVATGQNKIVQHLEGGIIKDILVSEGDFVKQGQPIIRLDGTLARANQSELFIRRARLEATQARLQAQIAQDDAIQLPDWLAQVQDHPEISMIIDSQRQAFEASKSGLANDISLVERNITGLDLRTEGYTIQLQSLEGQIALLTEEHEAKNSLFEKGLIPRASVLALQRVLLDTDGQVGRMTAEISEMAEMRQRFETEIIKATDERRRMALGELQVVQAELESVREKSRHAENVLTRTEVLAPVDGTVVRLHYHTTGGVIETGRPIAEILPADAPLIIEVLIPRNDIDNVKMGQAATVRLTALNRRTTPVLQARVSYISADSITDTADGGVREIYVAHVNLTPAELQRVSGFTPTPGMPAEIMIQTAERTFAQYLARPIVDSMSRAFREQ
ncbi:HlyD family type I secretion periplasmic adaptor subunit [Pseudoruegeria sp. SK021]|uniref:HlyD family type I secretion periplasmic adaptor subunit n=1 Tax=Pseudoruegeria sp. SK021 TaxID=1933035 RepID=UPI000A253FCB|nr:HlyD family type I secretion periplasmic adaptor subunit [Pseudoruegeria sp. SK021]OSP54789.1 secretion protein HlyD [Pseudoruegeria sp. SK021]